METISEHSASSTATPVTSHKSSGGSRRRAGSSPFINGTQNSNKKRHTRAGSESVFFSSLPYSLEQEDVSKLGPIRTLQYDDRNHW